LTEKKGFQASPFQGESSKKLAEFQAPSDDCPANPKSKIQNPKSGDNANGKAVQLRVEQVSGVNSAIDNQWISFDPTS
jgi:hypothetical protein